MLLWWNNKTTFWPLFAAVCWLALVAGTMQANAQSNSLPGPQTSPATTSTGTDKREETKQAPNSKSSDRGNSDFSSAIADLLAANPECAELSNNCQICIRKSAADADCSLPGVTCSRGTWSCTKTQNGSKLAQ